MLATFMEVLDTSIASVALPYIAGSVSATDSEATWVLTSYLVANAIILPTSSWFSQRFGRKRFLLICIVIFTVSSFACGAADSLAMILIARAVQELYNRSRRPFCSRVFRRRSAVRPWPCLDSEWWLPRFLDPPSAAGLPKLTPGAGRFTSIFQSVFLPSS
jgi:MFS family permease